MIESEIRKEEKESKDVRRKDDKKGGQGQKAKEKMKREHEKGPETTKRKGEREETQNYSSSLLMRPSQFHVKAF